VREEEEEEKEEEEEEKKRRCEKKREREEKCIKALPGCWLLLLLLCRNAKQLQIYAAIIFFSFHFFFDEFI
jgi:hypothetical protein